MATDPSTVRESVDDGEFDALDMLEVETLAKTLIRDALDKYDLMFGDVLCEGYSDLSKLTSKVYCSMDKVMVTEFQTMSLLAQRTATGELNAGTVLHYVADCSIDSSSVALSVGRSSVEAEGDTLLGVTASDGVHLDCCQRQKAHSPLIETRYSPLIDTSEAGCVLQNIKSKTSLGAAATVHEADCLIVHGPLTRSRDVAVVFENTRDLYGLVLRSDVEGEKAVVSMSSAFNLSDSSSADGASNPSAENASSDVRQEFDNTSTECCNMVDFADDNNNQLLDAQSPSVGQCEVKQFQAVYASDVHQKIWQNTRQSNFKVTIDIMQVFECVIIIVIIAFKSLTETCTSIL